MKIQVRFLLCFVTALTLSGFSAVAASPQWSRVDSQAWSKNQPWIVGANYIPGSAVNTLEMWQKETFSPADIERELSLAQSIGMNSVRVFLHDLVWQNDPVGFAQRIEIFLQIADRHKIKPMFVLFDSCWDSKPKAGAQPLPIAGVHNSRWVQSPGIDALLDPNEVSRFKVYVTGVVGHFAKDPRILAWDVWNEPDNVNESSYRDRIEKLEAVEKLLPQVFDWARSMDPIQPLTSGVWTGNWTSEATLTAIQKFQLNLSDVISFHSYDGVLQFEARVQSLLRYNRAILCTEYLARPFGNTIAVILPALKRLGIGAFNWGFVAGKTQTFLPWDSWSTPYPTPPPLWFHDLFDAKQDPFDPSEIQIFKELTAS